MKPRILGGMTLLALAASTSAAHTQQFEFAYTGSLVKFTVPISGTYQITAFGAQGAGSGGGGGGGSFVVGPDNTPLVIARAGGGCGGFRTRKERRPPNGRV